MAVIVQHRLATDYEQVLPIRLVSSEQSAEHLIRPAEDIQLTPLDVINRQRPQSRL